MKNLANSVCVALALAFAPLAGAQTVPPAGATAAAMPSRLTEADAERIGLAANPASAAALAGVNAAHDTWQSLAAIPNPNLSLSYATGTSTSPTISGASTDTFFNVGESLDTSGQHRYQAAGAHAAFYSTRYQYQETILGLRQQIRDAYWAYVAAKGQTQISMETLGDVQKTFDLTKVQLQAGASPKIDVVRAGIDVANAQQAVLQAQGAEKSALAALNTILARPPMAPVMPADSLVETAQTPDLLPGLPGLPELTRLALQNRPAIQSADQAVRVARYGVDQARASQYPDTSVNYSRSLDQGQDTVMLAVSLPLFDLGSIHHSIRSAEASQRQAGALETQLRQQVAQQVAQAYTDFVTARRQSLSYQADILNPSETLLGMAETGYKQGATGILPVIDAQNTLRNARNGFVTNLLALYKARDEILAATGKLRFGAAPPPR
ncbi:MAG: TolC family protein [Armatimonadetes bacterium]|nr:TolC family protein [Armatimonadota bacterium]MDE2205597.1 TolC family protein [Armatimonadota bacterium]